MTPDIINYRARIIGCGSYLPEKVLHNRDLEKMIDTSDEWITTRTGIKKRHIAAEKEYSSDMAYQASLRAIDDSGIDKSNIDLVIVCTNTPDLSFPSTANILQGKLKLGTTPSFDLQAICSGFLYGMQVADSMISKYETILLVCADKMSSILDWQDRSTCVLFGDGAGAVILQRTKGNYGIIDGKIYSDGYYCDILHTDGGVGSTGTSGLVKMNGQEVFRNAVAKMSESLKSIIKENGFTESDIDYFVPHQANIRIINSIATRLGVSDHKVIKTVDQHANCSAASIPLALSDMKAKNQLREDDLLAFTSFGAGATWGAMLYRW